MLGLLCSEYSHVSFIQTAFAQGNIETLHWQDTQIHAIFFDDTNFHTQIKDLFSHEIQKHKQFKDSKIANR